MTHFSAAIGRIYAADLLGASLGCLAVVAAMQLTPAPHVPVVVAARASSLRPLAVVAAMQLPPAPHVPVIVALLASATAVGAAVGGRGRAVMPFIACIVALPCLFSGIPAGLFTLRNVKNWHGFYSDYEAWNAFSRVSAFGHRGQAVDTLPLKKPSSEYPDSPGAMFLDIDGTAWTPMFQFNGDFASVGFLRESVNYLAHHLRPNGSVLIIGNGCGRDLLPARTFRQPA